jgi:hypothetical protein
VGIEDFGRKKLANQIERISWFNSFNLRENEAKRKPGGVTARLSFCFI